MKTLVPVRFIPYVTKFFPILLLLLFRVLFAVGATWYVKPGGSGTGSGSWSNAASATQLAAIISGAASGDQVWVAGGTYYPTTTTSRTLSFVLKSGVSVYGGFAGTETLLSQRNYTTHVTILSGDIGTSGLSSDNTYNVVVSTSNTGTAVLDGFTVTAGNANGSGQNSEGAGAYNYNTTVNYSNCIFQANSSTGNGGGLYAYGTTVTFTNCTFSNNSSSSEGGGMMIDANGGGGYTLTSCAFSGNTSAGNGGGLARDKTTAPYPLPSRDAVLRGIAAPVRRTTQVEEVFILPMGE
jgi:predicted outer membrane repeat protein